jgi:hypothetical protein
MDAMAEVRRNSLRLVLIKAVLSARVPSRLEFIFTSEPGSNKTLVQTKHSHVVD